MFCSQGMLASSVTKAFESVASPESSNPMTTERVCFYMLLSLKYCVLRVAGLYILETMLCFLCMLTGHHEFPPYGPDTLRSVYHIRNIEVFKLKQVALNSCTLHKTIYLSMKMCHRFIMNTFVTKSNFNFCPNLFPYRSRCPLTSS